MIVGDDSFAHNDDDNSDDDCVGNICIYEWSMV